MAKRSQAQVFIIASTEEIQDLRRKGYSLKEIHRCIPNLKDNLHYVTFLRVIPKLGIIEVKSKDKKISSTESTKNENFVNENHVTENDDKLSENAKRNRAKLNNRNPDFFYDASTDGKDLI